jgi:hypothetical protein
MGNAAKSTRHNRTLTVDFHDETTYFALLDNTKAFVEFVFAFILSLGFQLTHKSTCNGGGSLTRHSHYGVAGNTVRHSVCIADLHILREQRCQFA